MSGRKGQRKGIRHCCYCQGLLTQNSTCKNGKGFQSFHKDCKLWYDVYTRELVYVLLNPKHCICCGCVDYELGHITAPPDQVRPYKLTKTGLTSCYQADAGQILQHFFNGLIQPLCHPCNQSQGNGSYCRIHRKYLGVWNYLLNLDDLDRVIQI